ncbi:hypothetical protein KEM56_005319 [Ascosphaera pollenicola]|nr:hypothetical protein KEM56_005319 [Ascosphaera pollenicola]
MPPQPQPRRETPQGQPQFLQHNAAIQGRNLGQGVSQPAQIQSNINERNRTMTVQGQQVQVPYYPLPPQLGGVQNGAMPTAVTAGVKRPLSTTQPMNGTIVPPPNAKKPKPDRGSIPSSRPRESTVSQIPHRPAPQPGSYAAVPNAFQTTNHVMSTRGVKSRTDLISPIDREKALANTTYKTATIARDILISAGRHPTERPLNDHLKKLLDFKCVDNEMDLASFRWDLVDPIGEKPASTTTNKSSAATQVEKKATGGEDNQEKTEEVEEGKSTNAEKPKETKSSQTQGPSAKLLADFLGGAKKGPGDSESSKPDASLKPASKQ